MHAQECTNKLFVVIRVFANVCNSVGGVIIFLRFRTASCPACVCFGFCHMFCIPERTARFFSHLRPQRVEAGNCTRPPIEFTTHLRSPQVTSGHLRSPQVTSGHLRSAQVISAHFRSPQVFSSHLRSPQVTSCHLRSRAGQVEFLTCGRPEHAHAQECTTVLLNACAGMHNRMYS